jgi:hypothetical protein
MVGKALPNDRPTSDKLAWAMENVAQGIILRQPGQSLRQPRESLRQPGQVLR